MSSQVPMLMMCEASIPGRVAIVWSITGGAPTTFDDGFEDILVAARGETPWALDELWRRLAPAVAAYLRAGGGQARLDLPVTAASNVIGPARQAAGLPKWRKSRMVVSEIRTGLAAKTVLGVGVAAASFLGAGVAGVLPAPAQAALASAVTAVAPFHIPGSGHATPPTPNTGGAATGLSRAAQTPAATHIPTSTPPPNTGGAATGLNRAAQTPAATHIPTSTPPPSTGGTSTGSSHASQTPTASHAPAASGSGHSRR